jgi:hypothetical protein
MRYSDTKSNERITHVKEHKSGITNHFQRCSQVSSLVDIFIVAHADKLAAGSVIISL